MTVYPPIYWAVLCLPPSWSGLLGMMVFKYKFDWFGSMVKSRSGIYICELLTKIRIYYTRLFLKMTSAKFMITLLSIDMIKVFCFPALTCPRCIDTVVLTSNSVLQSLIDAVQVISDKSCRMDYPLEDEYDVNYHICPQPSPISGQVAKCGSIAGTITGRLDGKWVEMYRVCIGMKNE